jgi:hypothetical protein
MIDRLMSIGVIGCHHRHRCVRHQSCTKVVELSLPGMRDWDGDHVFEE